MRHEAVTHSVILLAVVAGIAAVLAGEFFHGAKNLVYVGGAIVVLAVAGLTAAIARA